MKRELDCRHTGAQPENYSFAKLEGQEIATEHSKAACFEPFGVRGRFAKKQFTEQAICQLWFAEFRVRFIALCVKVTRVRISREHGYSSEKYVTALRRQDSVHKHPWVF